MATERGLIEAKLRELVRAAETVAGCALEETLAPGDWADVIAAALRESRKADVETVRAHIEFGGVRSLALAALSRLAGDE